MIGRIESQRPNGPKLDSPGRQAWVSEYQGRPSPERARSAPRPVRFAFIVPPFQGYMTTWFLPQASGLGYRVSPLWGYWLRRHLLLKLPILVKEPRIDDLARLLAIGGRADVDHRPIGQLGRLQRVGVVVPLTEREATID